MPRQPLLPSALPRAMRTAQSAVWIAKNGHTPLTPVTGYENCDLYWPSHAIVGTKGFDFIPGLDPKAYSYQVYKGIEPAMHPYGACYHYKGIEPAMHPYGACYHDLKDTLSTGVIEFLKARGIKAVICGGLATDYCVKTTALQLARAGFTVILNLAACRGIAPDTGFTVILNLAACRGIAPDTVAAAIKEMQQQGVIIVKNSAELKELL